MDGRRSARVATSFWVAVEGVDAEPARRIGDVSGTGIYFEMDREIGDVGTVQWLHVSSADRARSVDVMACVVRTIALQDQRGKFHGVALEFMPESDAAAESLYELVRYVLSLRGEPLPTTQPRLVSRLDLGAPGSADATVRQLSVRSIVLETSWAVALGEVVKIDIVPPGSAKTLQLRGRATSVMAPPTPEARYQIEVEVDVEKPAPLHRRSSMSLAAVRPPIAPPSSPSSASSAPGAPRPRAPAIDAAPDRPDDGVVADTLDRLFATLIRPAEPEPVREPARELSGALSRVRLPTLCSLFEMERMSGTLSLRRGDDAAVIFLREGRIVDVEPSPGAPRARIGELLAWTEGTFEFAAGDVTREDRVCTSTTALVLDLAREDDEARHAGRGS